jgi:molybdate transport system regulatory protein
MNQLPGIISEILSEGHLSIVVINAAGCIFKAIVIDTPQTAPYLSIGNPVNMLFKENEVVIAKSFSGLISLQNKFDSTIKTLELGKLLCKVTMDFRGYKIISLITAHAAIQLNLTIGDSVTAMVKTNEISLSPHD